jgi:SPP1 family predicted phage head-tail adaptor
VRAGSLPHRLQLARKTLDAANVATWVPWKTVWAGIEPLEGRRRYLGARLQVEVNTRITTRFLSGVDAATVRGSVGTQVYDFEAVIDPLLAHRELRIDAVART